MAGLIPNNAALNGATITRQQLLLPYPQYTGITLAGVPIGKQYYHGFQSKVTKRYAQGLTFVASYTLMKNLEQVSLLNAQYFNLADPGATRLEKRSAGQIDLPQKFVIAGVYDLPFGQSRRFGATLPKAVDWLVGGWQLNFNITYQSGWVGSHPNAKQVKPGSPKLSSPSFTKWFDTSLWDDPATGARVKSQEPYTLRDYPTLFSDVRLPGYKNWDFSVNKYFSLREPLKLQFRCEMINAFNHPWFPNPASGATDVTSPNFGRLDPTQRNLPRWFKMALVLNW